MKKAMLLICGVIFFIGCTSKLNTTRGSDCEPKWFENQEDSTEEVVYGYSREQSRNSSLATTKGLARAQADALTQVNQFIDNDVKVAIEEIGAEAGKESAEEYREATTNTLKISLKSNCSNCVRVDYEDCEEDGYVIVYTKVKVSVSDYIDQEYMDKRDKLLEKSESLLEELKKD